MVNPPREAISLREVADGQDGSSGSYVFFRRRRWGGGDVQDCAVCLDGLWRRRRRRSSMACIEKWLSMHGAVPLCRQSDAGGGEGRWKKGGEEEEIDGDFAGEQRRAVERTILAAFGFNLGHFPGLTTQAATTITIGPAAASNG
ncbi:unnamed protein product [Spirodela intermedia]|uniref:Uncharacterized protein n=1 Tax=Spirodela intermedia TaxID=51605 RepID=A0A7I8ILK4_SPIIN|nr:unnamed protein product [Spirodela intermedia]CAA6658756.1 unnamed protein product [Spirodela intermedia]